MARKSQLRPYLDDIEGLYTADWDPKRTTRVSISEMQIELPVMPAEKEMKNYKLATHLQKYEPMRLPSDLRKWDKPSLDKYVSAMWHKRRNGEWWLIKGQPTYINRYAWTFYTFWHCEIGTLPLFRMEGVEFFQTWEDIVRDLYCLGMFDVKPRRIGDTEKALFLMWEACSRVYESNGGMQNVTDDDAQNNFLRLVNGHKKMPFFFKPISPLSDSPTQTLEFRYPQQFNSVKKLQEGEEEVPLIRPINGLIDYQPTTLGKYDGGRLLIYHMDEPGKIKAFDINAQWKKVRPTLTLNNGRKVVGKSLFTTTVEDFALGDDSTLARTEKMWNDSNPLDLGKDGRTVSGMRRVFRSARLSAEVDEWGFHKWKEAEEQLREEEARLLAISDYDAISEMKRKYPLTIEDVFAPSHQDCVLFPVLLQRRKVTLKEERDSRGQFIATRIAKLGNLSWARGEFGGDVVWTEDSRNGKWAISQHPVNPNHKIRGKGRKLAPTQAHVYSMGTDPIDAMLEGAGVTKGGNFTHSRGAGAIFRKYDELVDGHLQLDDEGNIMFPEEMYTEQYVCDYQHRPNDPEEFFEDMLKTALYYSVPMFFEKDKPSVQVWFISKGYENYLQDRPTETKFDKRTLRKKEQGAKATAPLVRLYTDALKYQVYNRIGTFWHPRILDCHNGYNVLNRGKRDLTVACGFALLGKMDESHRKTLDKAKDNWDNFKFNRYKYM